MAKKAEKLFIDGDGKESRHATPEARVLVVRFANGEEVELKPSELSKEIVMCAAFHGFSQKIGDSYAGAKTIDEAIEHAQAVVENLEEGTWIDRAEGAIRTSLLAEALHRCKGTKYPSVEEAAVTIKEWSPEKRKSVLDSEKGVPALVAAFVGLQAERAAARAEKAAKVAEGNAQGLDTL